MGVCIEQNIGGAICRLRECRFRCSAANALGMTTINRLSMLVLSRTHRDRSRQQGSAQRGASWRTPLVGSAIGAYTGESLDDRKTMGAQDARPRKTFGAG